VKCIHAPGKFLPVNLGIHTPRQVEASRNRELKISTAPTKRSCWNQALN